MPARRCITGLACSFGVLFAALLGAPATAAEAEPQARPYVPGELVVRFRAGVGATDQARALGTQELASRKRLRTPRVELVRLEPGSSVTAAAAALERRPEVRYAEPNYLYQPVLTPDDFYFPDLWGLHSTADDDIDMPEAWDLTTGSASVRVAVVDTGVNYTHPDLSANIWLNPGETANGLDDDGNGYADDLRGWDFENLDNNPSDDCGHGSHVAGTIGAQGNNSIGVVGINWQVKLMALRAGSCGGLPMDAIVNSFEYACEHGAKVVSGSFGGFVPSSALQDAIERCPGTLFVFAAGNGGADGIGDDLDSGGPSTYPCAHTAPNVVCVAATDWGDTLASFSNYGVESVDLAAPGTDILSTDHTGDYVFHDGTSMATPHVSGVAALLWAEYPSASVAAIKAALISTAEPKPALDGLVLSGGRLNAFAALQSGAPEPPPPPPPPPPLPPPPPPPDTTPPADPAVISTSHTRGVASRVTAVVVNWSGANDSDSGVDGFSYHWDTSPTTVPDGVKDAEETAASATSQAFSPGSYYFHLRTRDNHGNWSPGVHLGPFVIQAPPAPPPVVRCVVPRLAGKTLAAARTALARSRCAVGRVTRRRSKVRKGRVIAQSRRPGTRLARGTRIALTLSRGRR